jgi:hypothetical protein
MKTHAVLAAVLLMLGLAPATATVRIANDTGDRLVLTSQLSGVEGLRRTRRNRRYLRLGMHHVIGHHSPKSHLRHAARHSGLPQRMGDQAVTSDGNRILWSTYPESVRRWIKSHGGLHSQTITLSGPELAAMFPVCP